MLKKIGLLMLVMFLCVSVLPAQKQQAFELKSPDGSITLQITAGEKLLWSLQFKGQQIIEPSVISMQLQNGEILGEKVKVASVKTANINSQFNALFYKRAVVQDVCNQLTLNCTKDWGVIFRVYNDASAYRFFTKRKGEIIIKNEEANFNFSADHKAFIPIQWDYRDGQKFNTSFESLYREIPLSQFPRDSVAFLPLLVDAGPCKVEIIEADLEDYPGLNMDLNATGKGLKGVFAPYPLESQPKQWHWLNFIPTQRADYIAKTTGSRSFPWRAVIIADQDTDLLNCDIVQKLASPCRLTDVSWIKPGQVAWDWWNDWNISHVDFKAGINTETYKYFIDFAAANNIPYILLDAGWTKDGDLTQCIPVLNLKELVAYGEQKNVGLVLWALWYHILTQKDKAFPWFEQMGIKGLKIDFIDRDDQLAVASTFEIAQLAAQHHLMVDYHGVFKPAGIQRTYPNVVGNEGVKGMENVKWANEDVPRYDVTLPFIRNVAGPMDYTPGAMRNANRANFRPINSMPMSQGTRCHQLAMYVVYEVPLQMLSDNPTVYMQEQECTNFITKIPVMYDETVPLDGQVAEYVAIARKKGETWYIGAMSNWTPRDLTLDCSFLGAGEYTAAIFQDGVNADRDATDYKKVTRKLSAADKLTIHLAPGGGWAAILEKL
ncbi:MAG TPA: glycoside hydrolase family 97 protein [bacterium]|nr:glycoside hydrolase family 97 protein [bacterium]HPN46086.1 glycoside hydrolase family 97 protein [bacterium]